MIKTRKYMGAIAAVSAAFLTAGAASAASNITLCGGSPGGLWSLLGSGLDSAVRKIDPDSTVTYQTSSGGFSNIVQLGQGKCDMAIVHLGEIVIAQRGEAPFKEPTGGVSAVALLYDWAPMQWVTDRRFAEENNLTSIADLAGFQGNFDLVVNRRGILPSILAEKSMAHAGVTFEQLEENGGSVQFQGSKSASEIMQDGKAVSWVNATFVGSGSINSIANSRELTLLSVPDDVIARMQEDYGSKPVTIPAGAYEWLDREVKTFGASAALIAADDADPEMVKLVATAVYQHPEEIQRVHKAMGAFNTTLAASIGVVDYHPLATEVIAASGN